MAYMVAERQPSNLRVGSSNLSGRAAFSVLLVIPEPPLSHHAAPPSLCQQPRAANHNHLIRGAYGCRGL